MAAPALLRLQGITTYFAENQVTANDAVDLEIAAGEVHALVGENGAGKSTLMHVLSGYVMPSAGTMALNGKPVAFRSPADAIAQGIVMVHQHPPYVPGFRVWENVLLGVERTGRTGLLDRERAVELVSRVAAEHGLAIDPSARMHRLAASQIHFVALLAALVRKPQVLILDEPTAPCTEPEVALMFRMLRRLIAQGIAVVLITHKLKEVMEIADRVTVLRGGAVVASMPMQQTDAQQIAALMLGEDCQVGEQDQRLLDRLTSMTARNSAKLSASAPDPAAHPSDSRSVTGGNALELRNVSVFVDDLAVLDRVYLTADAGAILGVTGIRENGLEFLEDVLSGTISPDRGSILLNGRQVKRYSPRHFRHSGISYIPTDRILRGSSMDSTVAENLILLHRKDLQTGGVLRRKDVVEFTEALQRRYGISGLLHQPMRRLSGGNIQKVILSRELSGERRVVVFSEPSWGLDLRSRELMYTEMRVLRDRGAVVVLISADIDEVLAMADRIAVMYRGRVAGVLTGNERSRERIGEFMLGFQEHDVTGDGGGGQPGTIPLRGSSSR